MWTSPARWSGRWHGKQFDKTQHSPNDHESYGLLLAKHNPQMGNLTFLLAWSLNHPICFTHINPLLCSNPAFSWRSWSYRGPHRPTIRSHLLYLTPVVCLRDIVDLALRNFFFIDLPLKPHLAFSASLRNCIFATWIPKYCLRSDASLLAIASTSLAPSSCYRLRIAARCSSISQT